MGRKPLRSRQRVGREVRRGQLESGEFEARRDRAADEGPFARPPAEAFRRLPHACGDDGLRLKWCPCRFTGSLELDALSGLLVKPAMKPAIKVAMKADMKVAMKAGLF
jgi:hypothetical protein